MTPLTGKKLDELDWRIRVFDSLSFPTLILKPDRIIISANKIFLERFDTRLDKVIGKACHEIFFQSKDPCEAEICPLSKVLKTRKGNSSLSQRIEGDDETWEERVFSPILEDSGEIKYVMESIRDVTRVKALERALQEAKEFLENIIESSPSAIMAADRNGNILLMNRAAVELFGYSKNEIEQKKSVESIYPSGEAKEIMKRLRDEGDGGRGKLIHRKTNIINANNEQIPVEMNAAIIYEDGNEIATMGIYHDLREKLAVEQKLHEARVQLNQSEKMASMGQLAAGVAHEINNPLTGILFNAGMALEKTNAEDPNAYKLKSIIEDVHRCKDIVKNLLVYSRQTNPSKIILRFDSLIKDSLNLIRDQKLFGNVIVNRELSKEMINIRVDKNQITQVIINLVINACDAMEGEGILTLKTFRDKEKKKAYLDVIDTGCGIPEENLSRIFDPFFTTKEPGRGTGLGLSTCYGIIKENGGDISVIETGQEGTTFRVELPLYVPSDNELELL